MNLFHYTKFERNQFTHTCFTEKNCFSMHSHMEPCLNSFKKVSYFPTGRKEVLIFCFHFTYRKLDFFLRITQIKLSSKNIHLEDAFISDEVQRLDRKKGCCNFVLILLVTATSVLLSDENWIFISFLKHPIS